MNKLQAIILHKYKQVLWITTIILQIIVGIDETRARDICKEEYAIAKANWTHEAQGIAQERVMALEDKIMPKMKQHDETLRIFGDPAFN